MLLVSQAHDFRQAYLFLMPAWFIFIQAALNNSSQSVQHKSLPDKEQPTRAQNPDAKMAAKRICNPWHSIPNDRHHDRCTVATNIAYQLWSMSSTVFDRQRDTTVATTDNFDVATDRSLIVELALVLYQHHPAKMGLWRLGGYRCHLWSVLYVKSRIVWLLVSNKKQNHLDFCTYSESNRSNIYVNFMFMLHNI